MSVGHIDPVAFRETVEFIRQYDLYRSDAGIVAQLNSINLARPSHLDEEIFCVLQERVAKYAAYHDRFPFLTAPKNALKRGPIVIGYDYATLTPIGLSLLDATRHILIAGTTGSGKTTVATRIITSARAAGINVWIIDPKDDYRHIAAHDDDFLIFHRDIPVNLLERQPHLSTTDVRNAFLMINTIGLWLGVIQTGVLSDLYKKLEATDQAFTVHDLKALTDNAMGVKGASARREQLRSISVRLEQMIDQFPGPCTTPIGIPLSTLYKKSLHLSITADQGSIAQAVLFYLLHNLYLYQLRRQHRGTLSTLVVIDEALVALGRSANTPDGRTPVSHIENLARELGIGLVVLTTNLRLTDELIQSNAGTVISLKTNGGSETAIAARTLGLTPEQAALHQTQLAPGLGVVRLNSWGHPILAGFDPPPIGFSKTVNAQDWSDAIHRTDSLAPRTATTNENSVQFSPKAFLPPAEPSEPPAEPTHDTSPTRTIALGNMPEALLRSAVKRIATTTAHYAALDLHPQEGTRAKKTLVTHGFVIEERIVVRSGRGGTALALVPTSSGVARSGLKLPRGTRGGDSVQHRYLIQELATALDATVETLVGEKAIDLLLRAASSGHRVLRDFLQKTATNESFDASKMLDEASLLAIEVEVSDPPKTAPANVRRNHENGIALTIIAVLPKVLDATKRALNAKLSRADGPWIVVDVLQLLQLRKGHA